VLDTSKGVNILVSEGGDALEAYAGAGALKRPLRPLFAIPTTAGTGSEVTVAAVIVSSETGAKLLFASPFLLPHAAVIDPRMTLTLPPHLTAATAMDALTHAIEAFTSRQKNPLSEAYAVAAIATIAEQLPRVLDRPSDAEGRFALAQAATMAGIAFSSAMTGIVHALGHSLGATAHMHHGACMSLFLPYGLEHNLPSRARAIGELLLPLAGAERFARTPEEARPRATIRAVRDLRDRLHARCELPRTIAESGKVRREQLPAIARMTLDDGALSYNPEPLDYDTALALLERAWS
jgi:alcohol dehydrogenase